MSVITWPAGLYPQKMTFQQRRNDIEFRAVGFGAQAHEMSAPLWEIMIALPATFKDGDSEAGQWKSLMMKLKGKINQLAMYDPVRPAPLGTMRGTMTLSTGILQGATSMSIDAGVGQAGKTFKAGDPLGLGSGTTQQVVIVTDDATANGSGIISVNFEPPIRSAFSLGASVTWDKPCALFRAVESPAKWDYTGGTVVAGGTLHFLEDWRA